MAVSSIKKDPKWGLSNFVSSGATIYEKIFTQPIGPVCGCSASYRSKTLAVQDAPSTPTWWTRTLRHSTQPGPRTALRTANSSSRRQQA